ncbi:MAG: hypothetical protein IJZ30_06570 [Alphaproteobacteria bacterium]|nr:hypothetical protein [Alphaproteobacteria bacterium]
MRPSEILKRQPRLFFVKTNCKHYWEPYVSTPILKDGIWWKVYICTKCGGHKEVAVD